MTARMLAMAIGLLLLVPAAASAGTVGGTVTDEAGVGVGGVHVELFNRLGGGSAGATWTNASGQFTVTGSAGTYDVLFESHGELLSEWHGDTQDRALAQPLTVPETGTVTADAVLSPGGAITGTVTNSQGAPVPGVLVRASTADGASIFGAGAPFTDENGDYRIRRLPTGDYKVRFGDGSQAPDEWYDDSPSGDGAQLVPVTAGSTTGEINASLGLYGAIAGTITTADGTSATGGTVRLYQGAQVIASGNVGPGGAYTLSDVAPGRYRVQFTPPSRTVPLGEGLVSQFYGGAWFAEDAAELTVDDGETTVADWTLPREAALAGELRFPDGSPARAIATVFDLKGRRVGGGAVAGNGHWQARGLPAGQFKVAFSSAELLPYDPHALTPPAPFFVETEYYKDRYSLATANPVTATAGAIGSGFDTTLTRAGTITGVLTSSAGVPLKGVKVYLVRSDGRRAGPFRSDYKGRYTAFGLRAGSWTVRFVPEFSGLLSEYYDNSPTQAGATPITVGYGKTVQANATIARAARISGLVTDESRGSIPGVRVSAYNGFGELVASAVTTASGSYSLGRLPTGPFRIEFVPPAGSGFESEFYDNVAQLADAASVWATAGSTTAAIDAELAAL
jgi:hypothetical protein